MGPADASAPDADEGPRGLKAAAYTVRRKRRTGRCVRFGPQRVLYDATD